MAAPASDFLNGLEAKVAEQLNVQRVGYLLGAGSSYLDSTGYPLASELWDLIKNLISDTQKREDIQAKQSDSRKRWTYSMMGEQWIRRIGTWSQRRLRIYCCPKTQV